jgi:phospholipid/cholesterol/gamma-HCH transport system ATP-binding protein
MIEVKNVHKSFGEKDVLIDVSMQLHRGKVNMIIGKSGAGKSVMLKCLVGLHEVDSGQILFDNRDLCSTDYNGRKEIRKEVGMLFQASALFDFRTVLGNVMFPLEMFSDMDKNEREERARACLKRVNIKEEAFKLSPAEISGGMQKRVAIARAIALNPRYLFCDEPNSGLDPETSIVIDNLIKDITEEYQMTTVVISHDMNSVVEISDFIHLIHDGKEWWTGNRKEIFTTDNPEIIAFVYASKFMKEIRELKSASNK